MRARNSGFLLVLSLLLVVPGLQLPAAAASASSTGVSSGAELEAKLCAAFEVKAELTGKTAEATFAWMSQAAADDCQGIPPLPPTGEECVAGSGYLRECLACCVYENQTILSCAEACFTAFPSIPVRPVVVPPVTPEDECCKTWCATGAMGVTSCCNGAILSCDCTPQIDPIPELGDIMGHISSCVQECEGVHQYNQKCEPGQFNPIFNDPVCGHPCSECTVNRCFVSCMGEFDCDSVPEPALCREMMQEFARARDQFCTDCTNCRNNQNQP